MDAQFGTYDLRGSKSVSADGFDGKNKNLHGCNDFIPSLQVKMRFNSTTK